VFCDGDFWHGRHWATRRLRLTTGHNAAYWVAKIESNMRRDRRTRRELRSAGWTVLRFWESDILRDPDRAASKIGVLVTERLGLRPS
jgi:DNA mismatch endonuclease (patch repair protein)